MKRWTKALAAVVLLAGLLAPISLTQAQDAPKPAKEKPAAEKTTKPADDWDSLTVPFEFEGLIFIHVKVNGKGPYKFLFDSGASQSVVNERLADELGLKKHDMPGGGVQGVGTADAKLVVLDDIQIGGYKRGKCVAASMNLDHMSGSLGYHMMGIVGQNVIHMIKQIDIDFSASTLSFTKYGADEMPSDQDQTIINMLEGNGMGGIPGLPGLPGLPGEKKNDKKEGKKDKKDDDGDEFSAPALPPMSNYYLFQEMGKGGDKDGDHTTEAAEPKGPTEDQTLDYKTVSIPLMGDLIPYWYLDVKVNGEDKTFLFDTGASMLLAIGEDLNTDLGCTTSFGYPVKGIGKGEAKSTMIKSFQVGNLKEEDLPATTMKLPKMSDQLPQMMKMMIPLLKQQGITLDFDGIVGISLGARYKKLSVNTKTHKITFTAYGKDEENKISPYPGEEFFKNDVIRTWHGKAGKFGLDGDSVPLDDWKKYNLKDGGLMVSSVEEGGAAAKAGIKKGDIITHLVGLAKDVPEDMEDAEIKDGDVVVRDLPSLIMTAASKDPGTEMTVRVQRGDEVLELKVTLDKYGWEGTIPERWK